MNPSLSQIPQICISCNHTGMKKLSSMYGTFSIYRCENCGLGVTFPRLLDEELNKKYQQEYYGDDNIKFTPLLEKTVEWVTYRRAYWIHKMTPVKGKILDIGCGRGTLLKLLSRWGNIGYGIERNETAAAKAIKNNALNIYIKDLQQCNFSNNFFDTVILWHVLEHLDNPESVFTEIFRILKPDGKLVFEVPNYSSFQSMFSGKFWFHLDIERHLYHFTPSSLILLFKKNGFTLSFLKTYSFEQCPFGLLQSVLNSFGSSPEFLYKILKREVKVSLFTKLIHYTLAGIFVFPCFLLSLIEWLFGMGGVIRMVAIKNEVPKSEIVNPKS